MTAMCAAGTIGCAESDTDNPSVISHGKSLTSAGAPPIEREKKLSDLTQRERELFVDAVGVRIGRLLKASDLYENMCNVAGVMSVTGLTAVGETAQAAKQMCAEITVQCRDGMSTLPDTPIEIDPSPATFACDVPVDSMLGCLEESARVLEGIRDTAGDLSCSSPSSALESFTRRLRRLAPNGAQCEKVMAACPSIVVHGAATAQDDKAYDDGRLMSDEPEGNFGLMDSTDSADTHDHNAEPTDFDHLDDQDTDGHDDSDWPAPGFGDNDHGEYDAPEDADDGFENGDDAYDDEDDVDDDDNDDDDDDFDF
ncbi:MAG: hypothetical protein VX589_04200 [Myxococcota bacterium]|nr:hypothetical protein [Myxococcota bacterium]